MREAEAAIAAGNEAAKKADFDSLEQLRAIAKLLISMTAAEQRKENPDKKWVRDTAEAAARVIKDILPYEHRRLATLEPAMETVVKPDGSVHVTISKTDADI
jgi:hypothetical protein